MSAVASGVAIAVIAPLLVAITLLVRLTSRGPSLCAETRIGLDRRKDARSVENSRRITDLGGAPFSLYRFRTLHLDDSASGCDDQEWQRTPRSRVTGVGHLLRRYGLDELPQLFNVLRGDMNIVGPRPQEVPVFAALRKTIEQYENRQRVRPGLTGAAQIDRKSGTSMPELHRKFAADLDYIARRSSREDIRIMMRTVPSVFSRNGVM